MEVSNRFQGFSTLHPAEIVPLPLLYPPHPEHSILFQGVDSEVSKPRFNPGSDTY